MSNKANDQSLVGSTFLARMGRTAVPMKVEREELCWCFCRSLDLRFLGRWPSDAVRREIERQRVEADG